MITTTFNLGDVVYLNSGSTAMTVRQVKGDECTTIWIDKAGNEHQSTFKIWELAKENPNGIKFSF